ncbi:hypothetical protein LguiB_002668 [Lonicera macranthoides]
MASFPLLQNQLVAVTSATNIINPNVHALSSSSCYSLSIFVNNKDNNKLPSRLSAYGKQHYRHRNNISCKSTANGSAGDHKFDRRNVLLGLGGLYGIAGNLSLANNQSAIAVPVPGPDINRCGPATTFPNPDNDPRTVMYDCCLNKGTPVDYKIPTWSKKKRMRSAAQWVSDDFLAKYSTAIKTMKTLPKTDPHNFWNQAIVHCAYCNGAYKQLGFSDPKAPGGTKEMAVHFNWLFLPFHRWYLYFFERIVAKYTRGLEGQSVIDEDFALPFWNWDNAAGMEMPSIYLDTHYSLHDCYRDADHLDKLVDLRNGTSSANMSHQEWIEDNLSIVRAFMFQEQPADFFGAVFSGGDTPPNSAGSIERTHNMVHRWTGDPFQPHNEDMGNFYSAAKDPIFYGHHANIDRLWKVWNTLDPANNTDGAYYNDWKDSTFLFYDEDRKLARVKVRDCLNTDNLGYEYEKVDNPWINATTKSKTFRSPMAARRKTTAPANLVFPVKLNKVVKILVKRKAKSRSKEDKDKVAEVLVLEGIEYSMDKFVQFEVYVNDEDEIEHCRPIYTEYLGSFSSVPHVGQNSGPEMKGEAKLRLGLTKALEDLGADADDDIVIKLVPREGAEDVYVGSIKIELSPKV